MMSLPLCCMYFDFSPTKTLQRKLAERQRTLLDNSMSTTNLSGTLHSYIFFRVSHGKMEMPMQLSFLHICSYVLVHISPKSFVEIVHKMPEPFQHYINES